MGKAVIVATAPNKRKQAGKQVLLVLRSICSPRLMRGVRGAADKAAYLMG